MTMGYHWDWGVFFNAVPSGETTYLGWFFIGVKWTVFVSLSAWIIALVLGAICGVFRTVPNRWLANAATVHTELFRNIPLLVQLFIWYFVIPELLPWGLGQSVKNLHPLLQQYLAGTICLGLFTSARICEQTRAGIQSLSRGQQAAGLAMGLSLPQTYRYVLMPMAFRIIIPPLTSEFLNIFKNSAVVSTIGLIELSRQAQQLVDYTAQPYEAFIAVSLGYMFINVVIMVFMRWVEKMVRVPGYIGAESK